MKPSLIAASLETLIPLNISINIAGPAGAGKSRVVADVNKKLGRDFRDVRASQLDPVDLRGIPHVNGDGRTHWAIPDFLPREGVGTLFLDELVDASKSVQAACYQLVLDRRLGDYVVPDGWAVVAAGNRVFDRGASSRMFAPLANRFVHLDFEIDVDDWCRWAAGAGINPVVIAFIRWRPMHIHTFDPKATELAFASPRTYEFASRILDAKPAKEIEHELLAGTLGKGVAAELTGFLRVWRTLPNLDNVVMNPTTCLVPEADQVGTLNALAGGLARKSTPDNFDSIITYAKRMPREFQLCLVKDATNRTPDVMSTPSFITWAAENSDLIN